MSIIVFVITLTLIIWRPKGLGIGFSALGGALLAFATGVVTLDNIWEIRVILGNTTFTLLAFLAIRWILEKAGVFRWFAGLISRRLFPNGRFLFIGFLLGSAIAIGWGRVFQPICLVAQISANPPLQLSLNNLVGAGSPKF